MLIGDPPDMIIAMRANLSFNDFLIHLMPIDVVPVIDFIGLRVVQQRCGRPRVLDSPLDRGTAVCRCLPRIWRDLIAKYEPAQLRRCLEYSPSSLSASRCAGSCIPSPPLMRSSEPD
jgi:hypothetical protein